jgi:hypothetical protein
MSISGLWQFLIVCVELLLIGAIIFVGIDFVVVANDQFKRLAKLVVGGALLLYFLFAVGAVFGFGGGTEALAISPVALIWLGVGIIFLFGLIYIVNMVVDWLAPEPIKGVIKFIISLIGIILMLAIAANTLSGGALVGAHSTFQLRR